MFPSLPLGRFMQELTEMLGFRPYQFYYYTWKYVSPICMAVLMTASIIQLGVSPPGYSAWIREEVSRVSTPALLIPPAGTHPTLLAVVFPCCPEGLS